MMQDEFVAHVPNVQAGAGKSSGRRILPAPGEKGCGQRSVPMGGRDETPRQNQSFNFMIDIVL